MLHRLLALIAAFAAPLAFAADVELNKATEAQLDGLKGIGPPTTRLILAERGKAEFKDWADFIARVKGMGEARATRLSAEGLRVNGVAFR